MTSLNSRGGYCRNGVDCACTLDSHKTCFVPDDTEPKKKTGFFSKAKKVGRVALKIVAAASPFIKKLGLWGILFQAADQTIDKLNDKEKNGHNNRL